MPVFEQDVGPRQGNLESAQQIHDLVLLKSLAPSRGGDRMASLEAGSLSPGLDNPPHTTGREGIVTYPQGRTLRVTLGNRSKQRPGLDSGDLQPGPYSPQGAQLEDRPLALLVGLRAPHRHGYQGSITKADGSTLGGLASDRARLVMPVTWPWPRSVAERRNPASTRSLNGPTGSGSPV